MRKISFLYSTLFALTCSLSAMSSYAQEKTPAFPGAEGFGRYTTGGRGGQVYFVTNLNDSGEGSLRWALSQTGPRTIIFRTSGTIHLASKLSIPENTTIAGQTAPGDGICIADYPVDIKGDNVIVRYMRFRLGNKNVKLDGADGWDGFGGFDHKDWMIDHCSISWSIDECLSVLGNKNTTVQWCLVAQSLVNSGHSKGSHGYGGNWGGSGASFHHNLIAHHTSRTPRLGPRPTTQLDERMDMRNNVIYNYGTNGCYGGEAMTVNIVNNYYKPGPGSPTDKKGYRIAGVGIRTNDYVTKYPDYAPALHIWGKYYVDGNFNSKYSTVNSDNWTYGVIKQVDANNCDGTFTDVTKDTIRLESPMNYILTTTHSVSDAYDRVLDYAGASLHRDSFDEMMVNDTRNGVASYTGNGLGSGFVNSQDDNKPANAGDDWSAWPNLIAATPVTDADNDGIDDAWELANGLDPQNPYDASFYTADGYTNLEVYINSLVADITEAQNAGGVQTGDIVKSEETAKEYEISPSTHLSEWVFNNGFTITTTKEYAEGTSCGMTGIKLSRNSTYTINIPSGIKVTKAEFQGYCNLDDGTAYLSKLGTASYTATEYTFLSRKNETAEIHTVELATPAEGTLPVTFSGGGQVVMIIKLYTSTTDGIESVQKFTLSPSDGAIYNINGVKVDSTTPKGVYIRNGKKFIAR